VANSARGGHGERNAPVILLSLISELMVTCLDDRMVNTRNRGVILSLLTQTGTRLCRRPWLKRSLRSLSHVMSRPSYCGNWWPTLLMVATRNAPTPAPTTYCDFVATHPPLFTEAREPLEADHWIRVIESKFGSCTARRCRRLSSPRSSYVAMLARGGPTMPPLAPWTTRCCGPSSIALFTPTTSQ
jgi:hypothetical protein